MKKSFFEIGLQQKTDKISQHGYHFIYPNILDKYRDLKDKGIIEIGIENKYSLNLWLEYFPYSFIYGMDINLECNGERFSILKGDQSNKNDLINLKENINKPIFFIIDDGSHIPEHQILTFDILFEKLEPGGTYIIEDIETSYWTKEFIYNYKTNYGYQNKNSIIEIFKDLLDDINSEFLTEENKQIQLSKRKENVSITNRKNISSILFFHNSIIITKKTKEELDFYRERDYYWKNRL